jgi:hypothetical protein
MKKLIEKKGNPWNRAYELYKDKYTREDIDDMLFCEITELLEETEQKEEKDLALWAEKDEINTWMGTSYHGDCFLATINELKTIFDSPDRVGDKKDKVQYEWLLDLEVSNTLKTSAPITIYDWKEYRDYHKDEYIRFHIGGFSSRITKLAKKEIEKVLTIYNNQDE